jgi:DNA-binding CsgD family transcriptional regulator
MVIFDDARRYVEVNTPALLWFRLSLAELRKRRVGDLSPPERLGPIDDAWARLTQTGCIAGTIQAESLEGEPFEITYYALTQVLSGRHLVAFAPSEWLERELLRESERSQRGKPPSLTARELEVLQLAAEGQSGPAIAERLVVSPATVRTHFANIYTKLGVRDRAGAVATAMRLGLIA